MALAAGSRGSVIPGDVVFANQIEKETGEGNENKEVNSQLDMQTKKILDDHKDTGEDSTAENDKTDGTQKAHKENEDIPEHEKVSSVDSEKIKKEASEIETVVPIYNYEIDNLVVPTTYAMSLNPYEMPIVVKDDIISTDQVVSRKYGVINKSSTDKIVTITFTVEDLNKDKITFVDSEEEVKNADKDSYAVYLSVIPADGGKIKIDGTDADIDTSPSSLSDVEMEEAKKLAIPLHAGENRIAFRLSKAIYNFGDGASLGEKKPKGSPEEILDLISLNPDGRSVTAFTFGGAMNQKAEWGKLLKGIKVTATYEYETADGTEKIIDGTGNMVAVD